MAIDDDTNAVQLKKPGPLTRAAGGLSIDAMPTDPDTDGRRQYSPNYGDAFANRGGSSSPSGPGNGPDSTALNYSSQGIAAPVQSGAAPVVRSPSVLQSTGILAGMAEKSGQSITRDQATGIAAITQPGRNADGVITADSAKDTYGADMQRSGGIFGTYDGKAVNDILAREVAIRGELQKMKDDSSGLMPTGFYGELPDRTPQPQSGPSISDIQSLMKSAGTRTERAAYGQALNQSIAGQNQQAIEAMRLQGDMNQRGIAAGMDRARQESIDQRAAERNQTQMRGQDMTASTAADRMASQERIAGNRQEPGLRLTLPQVRLNKEIDVARERIAGMDPAEIKRKTANYTATGRENPDFDPTLSKAVSQANRRKYGADDHFDQREQAQQQPGTDGDVVTRFRGDQAMQGHKTGQMTAQGLEVFDASGRLIGHYR